MIDNFRKRCIRMSDIISILFAPNLNLLQCLQHEILDKIQFAMAAILKFKMADEDVVEKNGTKVFWIQHPQIDKVSPKNQFWHDYLTGFHSSLY